MEVLVKMGKLDITTAARALNLLNKLNIIK
jgi:hypothetical protein